MMDSKIYLKSAKSRLMFWGWFVLFAFLSRPIHEFGHWIIYRLYGIDVYFTLNQVIPKDFVSYRILPELGGPLINIMLLIIGCVALKWSKYKEFSLALVITSALTRLVPYFLIGLYRVWETNDEGVVALALKLPLTSLYLVFGVFFVAVLLYIFIQQEGLLRNKLRSLSLQIITYYFIIVVIMGKIQEMYFENYDTSTIIQHIRW